MGPYFLDKFAKYLWIEGSRNGRLPTRGSPMGPGGSGGDLLLRTRRKVV